MSTILTLLVAFELKHFLADYCLQTAWMISGKGRFTSAGGYIHAGLHAAASLALLVFVMPLAPALILCSLEFVAHYLIDMGKERVSRFIAPSEIALSWRLHGLDQCLHQLTYILMAASAVGLAVHA